MKTLKFIILYLVIYSHVCAEEMINSFHSDITLSSNGLITVVENIAVNAENQQINRGIYRDFPTQYFGAWLTKKEVGFKVITVLRNGVPEPYHTEKTSHGIRIYIGSGDVYLMRGIHHYQLTYQTNKQLGYFDQYDEFYWNVTGTGWVFPISKASVTIDWPHEGDVQILDQQAWTGYQGQEASNFKINNVGQTLGFETTKQLDPYQGLTIGIQFPKGVFTPEPFNLAAFLAANLVWLLAVLVTLFYLGFYLSAWYRYGKDPEPGVIMARYYPPENVSPAAVHYIENEGADGKTLTVGLLSLAVKGYLKIIQLKKQYRIRLSKPDKNVKLSQGEAALKKKLFSGRQKEVIISKQYNAYMSHARGKLFSLLKEEYHKKCFVDNRFYVIWGWVISLVCFYCVTLVLYSAQFTAFELFLAMFTISVFITIALAFILVVPIFMGLLFICILIGSYLEIFQLLIDHSTWLLFSLFLICLNLLFAYLLRSPTPFGRHIKDQIDGLKLYMKSAEESRLNVMNPPEKTTEHYEALLPYAVALGLENQWAEKFSKLVSNQVKESNKPVNSYQPKWYVSQYNDKNHIGFSVAKMSQSFNRSITKASEIPSAKGSASSSSYSSSSSSSASSSYSSGGSSGGGGGGGGGGGW